MADFVPFLVKFLDSRLGCGVNKDLVDSGLNLLWQVSADFLALVLLQLLSQLWFMTYDLDGAECIKRSG